MNVASPAPDAVPHCDCIAPWNVSDMGPLLGMPRLSGLRAAPRCSTPESALLGCAADHLREDGAIEDGGILPAQTAAHCAAARTRR